MNRFELSLRSVRKGLLLVLLGVLGASRLHAQTHPTAAQVTAVAYAPPSKTATLYTTFVDWDSLTPRANASGFSRAVFDNPTPVLEKFEVHITTLNAGMTTHAPHHHAWEEMILVKEGELNISLNGKINHAGLGSLAFFASHDAHNIQNDSDKPATYYVINFYTDRVHTTPDKPAAEQAVPGMLPSCVIDCNSKAATPTAYGSTTNVVDSPTLTFLSFSSHITTLNPGQVMKVDLTDPADELFILKSGLLEVTINGVTARVKEGSLFYCAPNDKRTCRNIGATPAAYQVIRIASSKTPKPVGG